MPRPSPGGGTYRRAAAGASQGVMCLASVSQLRPMTVAHDQLRAGLLPDSHAHTTRCLLTAERTDDALSHTHSEKRGKKRNIVPHQQHGGTFLFDLCTLKIERMKRIHGALERKTRHKGLICSKWTTALVRALQGYLCESACVYSSPSGRKKAFVFQLRATRFPRFPRDIFVHIKRTDSLKCPIWWYNQIVS